MISKKLIYFCSKPVVISYTGTMLKMDVRKHQALPQGAKIIAANHPSTTDPFFVASMLRQQSFILIKDILFQVPLLGAYLKRAGHIPVEAGKGQEAIDAAVALLKKGHTVVIFPEGVISPLEGGFHEARTGCSPHCINERRAGHSGRHPFGSQPPALDPFNRARCGGLRSLVPARAIQYHDRLTPAF
jgi:1-acyl-sn-glycerol-3-phosphate acyltransferase